MLRVDESFVACIEKSIVSSLQIFCHTVINVLYDRLRLLSSKQGVFAERLFHRQNISSRELLTQQDVLKKYPC